MDWLFWSVGVYGSSSGGTVVADWNRYYERLYAKPIIKIMLKKLARKYKMPMTRTLEAIIDGAYKAAGLSDEKHTGKQQNSAEIVGNQEESQ